MRSFDNNDVEVPKNISHNAEGYKYPFDFGSFVKQKYMPNSHQFYFPINSGFEIKIKERLENLWQGIKKYE